MAAEPVKYINAKSLSEWENHSERLFDLSDIRHAQFDKVLAADPPTFSYPKRGQLAPADQIVDCIFVDAQKIRHFIRFQNLR